MKGLICIDIDGTLTSVRDSVPEEVICYLHQRVQEGYHILFVTGRTFFWSMYLLKNMPFSFYLAVLNGAYIAHMPAHTFIAKQYLATKTSKEALIRLEKVDAGVVLYTGPERDEKSYFCTQYASPVIVQHLEARRVALKERWEVIKNIDDLPNISFAALRAFCLPHTAKEVSMEFESLLDAHAPMMTDSYDAQFLIVQLTHAQVSKGHALDIVKKHVGGPDLVIACGDDYNDISMLKKADFAVVMNTAPSAVLALADIIAPSSKENGLIIGLNKLFENKFRK
jgi:Cof subfamily protein (haloacid dehalogenase superfamily)